MNGIPCELVRLQKSLRSAHAELYLSSAELGSRESLQKSVSYKPWKYSVYDLKA